MAGDVKSPSNFEILTARPIDARFSVATIIERNALDFKYSGLRTFVEENGITYLWDGVKWINADQPDMEANTVKVNNTNTTDSPINLVIPENTILGRKIGENITAIPIAAIFQQNSNTAYVSMYGNDGTGVVGYRDRAFATLYNAYQAAVANNSDNIYIYVEQGDYTETENLLLQFDNYGLIRNVYIIFENATLTYAHSKYIGTSTIVSGVSYCNLFLYGIGKSTINSRILNTSVACNVYIKNLTFNKNSIDYPFAFTLETGDVTIQCSNISIIDSTITNSSADYTNNFNGYSSVIHFQNNGKKVIINSKITGDCYLLISGGNESYIDNSIFINEGANPYYFLVGLSGNNSILKNSYIKTYSSTNATGGIGVGLSNNLYLTIENCQFDTQQYSIIGSYSGLNIQTGGQFIIRNNLFKSSYGNVNILWGDDEANPGTLIPNASIIDGNVYNKPNLTLSAYTGWIGNNIHNPDLKINSTIYNL